MTAMVALGVRVGQTMENGNGNHGNDNHGNDEWETPTAEAMDPHQARSNEHPTSTECLARIPRIVLQHNSAILHEATVTISVQRGEASREELELDATIGEFPPHPPYDRKGRLELCRPIHGSKSTTQPAPI